MVLVVFSRNRMPPYFSVQQRSFISKVYWQTRSYVETQRRFALAFPRARIPTKGGIKYNVEKFDQHGTVRNRHKEACGARRRARNRANIAAVRRTLRRNPNSTCRRNAVPHISRSTFNNIVRFDLAWHPYKIQRRHALKPGDYGRRQRFSRWLQNRPRAWLNNTLVVDEANFYVNGSVSTNNVRCYAPKGQPPRNFTYDIPDDKRKLVVWMGIMGNNTVLGPVFVDGNLNAQKYLDIINGTIVPHLTRQYGAFQNGAIRRANFLQDGASAHRARVVQQRLRQLFPGRVVGLGFDQEWPPRSPDLTACDFFLWGHLKAQVYSEGPPANIQTLRQRITTAVARLRRVDTAGRAVNSMRERAGRCIALRGRQVEGRAGH